MAKKIRLHFNAFITIVLSLFGVGSFSCAKYGVPFGKYEVSAHVKSEQGDDLEGIHVIRKSTKGQFIPDTLTTNTDGRVFKTYGGNIEKEECCVLIAEDPDSVYQTTPKMVKYRYVSDNEAFSWGTGVVDVEIEMKKKQ